MRYERAGVRRDSQHVRGGDMSEPGEPDMEFSEDDRKGADLHPPAPGDDDEEPAEEQDQ